jgi:hypothetical protein
MQRSENKVLYPVTNPAEKEKEREEEEKYFSPYFQITKQTLLRNQTHTKQKTHTKQNTHTKLLFFLKPN